MNRTFKNIANLGKYFRLSDTPPLFEKGKMKFCMIQITKNL